MSKVSLFIKNLMRFLIHLHILFRVGCPDLHDKGGWGYGFSYKNSHIWNDYVLDSWHSYPSGILNLEKNDIFGNSWDISYFSETECAPGYQDKGAVIFWNKNKKEIYVNAKIDLHFEISQSQQAI